MTGIIIKITGGFYYVEVNDTVYECKARGVFRKRGFTPLVGDRVVIDVPQDGYCSINSICERKNSLVRPALANLDVLVIVSSVVEPNINTYIIDKMICAAVEKDIEPVVVFSKTDLQSCQDYIEIYKQSNIKAIEYSSVTMKGLEEIKSILNGKVSAFSGNTGVGKSTLLNALFPELSLETGEISDKLGRGRHTTRTVELFKCFGGYVADTPGFSTVDLDRYEIIKKDDLQYCFPEFSEYIGDCQFTSCAHVCEKGCAVIKAVVDGVIPKSRHDSYVRMYNEVKDLKDWQLPKK
ncbi:MAG: ribosome small subunit-dependent GTPase A [Ruminococcaceae bacterium]|nr:ribosome small subunit-dependent GTPase A [Oscillospiraceae bacterium]